MNPAFSHIRDWIFDLDNCLYPASTKLFDLIDERMGAYIQRLLNVDPVEARRIQKMHFHGSGTTLAGLMKHHDVDPLHFMNDVHDIPLDRVVRDDRLVNAISSLPGRKFVHTNGNADYARKVLDRLGIAAELDHLHDIFAADLRHKPDEHGYRKLIDQFGPFEIHGDAEFLKPLDALLASFVRQRRMKLSGEYKPCYRIVA